MTGALFIPLLGIQNDEALFGSGIYEPSGAVFRIPYHRHRIPFMIMSYVGALKAWIYAAVFRWWGPSAASVRVPVLLFGAATVWLLFVTLRRSAGARAALAGCILLATDVTVLLTTCLDWGPVALQHLLLWGALALLLKHYQEGGLGWLGTAFFLLGLAFWDKALFIWSMGGVGIATLVVFPRELLRMISWRRIIVTVPAFCLGSLPLLIYNVRQPLATFRSNAVYDASEIPGKVRLLQFTLEGSALVEWVSPINGPNPLPPRGVLQDLASAVDRMAGRRWTNLNGYAFLLALLLFPVVVWREWGKPRSPTRALLFAVIFFLVAWLQMAFNKSTGGGAHHTILLWPLPLWFMAVTFAAASRWLRWGKLVLGVVLAVLASANLLVINRYYVDAFRYGGTPNWTDAIYPLSNYMKNTHAHEVLTVDWGILDALRLLNRGTLPLRVGSEFDNVELIRQRVSNPDNLFIGHTEGREFFTGHRARLAGMARDFGYRPEVLQVISDRNGRPTFEVYRFLR